jgi:hypothetical protein
MTTTIEAMRAARKCLHDGIGVSAVCNALDEAITHEEAQSVEPVGYAIYAINGRGQSTLYDMKPWAGDKSMRDDGGQGEYWSGNEKLFTHPAPAKQPLDSEREALIAAFADLISGMHTRAINNVTVKSSTLKSFADEVGVLARKAADMLAADAQRYEQGARDALHATITYLVHGNADFSGFPEGLASHLVERVNQLKQQVAVPQEPVLYQFRNIIDGKPVNAWSEVNPRNPNMQTLQEAIQELLAYRYKNLPCYEVRALYTKPQPQGDKA